jgi:hypothetical protein
MADESGPAGVLQPLGKTVVELLRLPMDLGRDAMPDLQAQIKDVPDIIRQNARFMSKQFQELPATIRENIANAGKQGNAPLAAAQAVSPLPILTPQQIIEMSQKNVPKPPIPTAAPATK